MCNSPRPTKKPLGPIPENPPEVKYFNFCHFSIFAAYLNELLQGDLSLGLQIFVVCSEDATWEKLCYLRLYVKECGRGVLSKSAIFYNVIFSAVVFEQTPPTGFVCSASKFFSTLRTCNLRKVVLFVTLRQRAWPWRAVKVGHFEFSGSFFQCLGTNSSQGFCLFCFKIGQYSQMMVLNKQCPICDSSSKGVAVAFRQSWFCGLFFQCLWTNSSQGICPFCFKINQYTQKMVLNKLCAFSKFVNKLPPGNLSVLL